MWPSRAPGYRKILVSVVRFSSDIIYRAKHDISLRSNKSRNGIQLRLTPRISLSPPDIVRGVLSPLATILQALTDPLFCDCAG